MLLCKRTPLPVASRVPFSVSELLDVKHERRERGDERERLGVLDELRLGRLMDLDGN